MSLVKWAALGGGDWDKATNWSSSPSLPGPGDTVSISTSQAATITHGVYLSVDQVGGLSVAGKDLLWVNGGTLTVDGAASFAGGLMVSGNPGVAGTLDLDGASTAASFTQSSGALGGTGTLTVTGSAAFGSFSTETGAGTTILRGTSTMSSSSGPALCLIYGRTLVNEGTLKLSAGIDTGTDGYGGDDGMGTVVNAAGATILCAAGAGVGGESGSLFTNQGTLKVAAGGATADQFSIPVNNSGLIEVDSGQLVLKDGGGWSGGSVSVATGAVLLLGEGNFNFSGVVMDDSPAGSTGALTLGGGDLDVSAAATIDAPFSMGSDVGGILGAGVLTLAGPVTFNQGLQAGSGTTRLLGATTIALGNGTSIDLDAGRVLENAGVLDWITGPYNYGGQILLGHDPNGGTVGGGTIQNDAGATFDFQGDGMVVSNGAGTNVFVNAGTLEKTAGTGTDTIAVRLYDTGRIAVTAGVLDLAGGGSASGGAITVATGATLEIGSGVFTVQAGEIAGGGAVTAAPGAMLDTVYTLTAGVDTIAGSSLGDNTIVAAAGTLGAGDKINGGPDANTLELVGGGVFNLAQPRTLTNIADVTATEGTGAAAPTIDLRSGLNVILTLADGTGAKPGATVVGGADASIINLGDGADTVVVGSAKETVTGGGGPDLIKVTAATIGAKINGGAGASVLELTAGSSAAMGANITNIHAVKLAVAATFTANGLSGLTVTGSAGADTLIAGGAGQTLTGDGGDDTLVGWSGGGDTFKDTMANLSLDTIKGFVAGDSIDLANLRFSKSKPTTATWSGGVLTVSQGASVTRIALPGAFPGAFTASSDGGAGTLITYAPPAPAALAQAMATLASPVGAIPWPAPVAGMPHSTTPRLASPA
jgi:hypothetical protein